MNAESTFPAHYDVDFIIQKAGVRNHFGYARQPDGIVFRYQVSDYDSVMAAFNNYAVDYLAVMAPNMLAQVAQMRADRSLNFRFSIGDVSLPITLNDKTIANLTAATVGLQRNADVLSVDWALDDATSAELPRDVVLAMADAAFRHVQQCFTAQKVIGAEVKSAADIEVLRAIDLANHPAWSPA